MNIKEATTKELVAYYNANINELPANIRGIRKPVTKFADRKSAERRVQELMGDLKELDAPKKIHSEKKTSPKEEKSSTRAAAIAKSWTVKAVAKKRAQRTAVTVDGVEYRSVAAAYRELGLPLNDHIAFRMLLKETGSQRVDGRAWAIVSK